MAESDPPAVAASPQLVLGNLGEFHPNTDSITSYLKRVQLYFEANPVEEDRRVAVLLTVVGAEAYETLRSLLAQALPRDKSFADLLGELNKHYDPKPSVLQNVLNSTNDPREPESLLPSLWRTYHAYNQLISKLLFQYSSQKINI